MQILFAKLCQQVYNYKKNTKKFGFFKISLYVYNIKRKLTATN